MHVPPFEEPEYWRGVWPPKGPLVYCQSCGVWMEQSQPCEHVIADKTRYPQSHPSRSRGMLDFGCASTFAQPPLSLRRQGAGHFVTH